MQVPERLALIGGGILLSSTLVFTLKSQASTIIPNVSHSISGVFDHIDDAQKSSNFNERYQQAQKAGEITGNWGDAPYYIDKDNNMYVGSGELSGQISKILDSQHFNSLQTINFDQSVQAPQDSSSLLSGSSNVFGTQVTNSSNIVAINGLENLDTSRTTNMMGMFADNNHLSNLDLSSLDTSNVTDMGLMFYRDMSLSNVSINNWNVSKVSNAGAMFDIANSIKELDLSGWHTDNLNTTGYMFYGMTSLQSLNLANMNTNKLDNAPGMFTNNNSLAKITLGSETKLSNLELNGNQWRNGNDTLNNQQLQDGNIHPGTWVKQ